VHPNNDGPSARTRAFVAFTLRHARVLWLLALLAAIPALIRTVSVYRHLRSELDELLPPNAQSVVAIRELRARMPGLQHLGVIVDTGDPRNLAAAERFLDDLEARVRTYPPDLVRTVRTGIQSEREFLEKHAPLYLELADLKLVRQRIEARRDWEASKAFGSNLDEEQEPSLDFKDIEAKYQNKQNASAKFPNQRFSNSEQHVTLLLVEVGGLDTGARRGGELLARVKSDIAALGGVHRYAPGMRLGFTGDVAINVEELSALVADLMLSSLLVMVAVVFVILAFYRWWASVPILLVPLLLGTIYSFGLVTLPPLSIRELNSNTAFLGAIIIGNGINFGIILLARYVEVRRRNVDIEEALVRAVWGARVGTLSAALAAGTAYASLVITDFRGFRQFGVIGGVGMLVCWATAFLLTPSLIRAFDRGDALTRPRAGRADGALMRHVARLVQRAPRAVLFVAAAVTALSLTQLRNLGHDRFEFDFSKLRRADTFVDGEGYWGRKMDRLLGRYLSPTVFLTDSREQTVKLAQHMKEVTKGPPLAEITSNVMTIDDVVPPEQPAKLEELKAIRTMMTPSVRARVPAEYARFVDTVLGDGQLASIAPGDLPPIFTTGMRERDGTLDRAVLLYPRPSPALWNGDRLIELAAAERSAAEHTGGRPARVAGSLLLSADIIDAIYRDGLKATFAALGGVILIVLVLFRRNPATVFVIASLIASVLWLTALTIVTGVKLNFANFIAFPITFGIGVDYSVNVMARYLQDGTGDVSDAVASTGGAVGLCSVTTIIGYSSLLVAENRALFSFGMIAVLGEIACLVAAVVVLPALLLVVRRRFSQQTSAASAE